MYSLKELHVRSYQLLGLSAKVKQCEQYVDNAADKAIDLLKQNFQGAELQGHRDVINAARNLLVEYYNCEQAAEEYKKVFPTALNKYKQIIEEKFDTTHFVVNNLRNQQETAKKPLKPAIKLPKQEDKQPVQEDKQPEQPVQQDQKPAQQDQKPVQQDQQPAAQPEQAAAQPEQAAINQQQNLNQGQELLDKIKELPWYYKAGISTATLTQFASMMGYKMVMQLCRDSNSWNPFKSQSCSSFDALPVLEAAALIGTAGHYAYRRYMQQPQQAAAANNANAEAEVVAQQPQPQQPAAAIQEFTANPNKANDQGQENRLVEYTVEPSKKLN